MAAIYRGYVPNAELREDDIAGIQALYGNYLLVYTNHTPIHQNIHTQNKKQKTRQKVNKLAPRHQKKIKSQGNNKEKKEKFFIYSKGLINPMKKNITRPPPQQMFKSC